MKNKGNVVSWQALLEGGAPPFKEVCVKIKTPLSIIVES
jgi:hypothetical protein